MGPQEISLQPGSRPLFQADNKGLNSKYPPHPQPPSHCGFSRPRGKRGPEQVTVLLQRVDSGPFRHRKVSFQQSLFVSPKSPGDSVPRQNDSLAHRPCLALGDAQPGHFSPQTRLQVHLGSTALAWVETPPQEGSTHEPSGLTLAWDAPVQVCWLRPGVQTVPLHTGV